MFKFFKRKKTQSPRDAVTRIFLETLELDAVAPQANFFELGGDSITATVVVTALGDAGYVLPSTAVFDHPSIDGLVKLIEMPEVSQDVAAPVAPKPRATDGSATMQASHLQARLWPYERNPDPARFQLRGEGAALLRGPLDVAILRESLTLLIERHEVLRTSFTESNETLFAHVHPPAPIDLEELEATGDTPADKRSHASQLVSSVTSRVFELDAPSPFRCALIRISDDEHVLAVSMHHIISDGWSMGLFVNEIAVAYEALAKQKKPSLPVLAYQFADYAAWHHDWLASASGASSVAFWRDYLNRVPPALEVPIPAADAPRKSTFNFPVQRQQIEISRKTQSKMRDLAKATQTSVHTIFLASVLNAFNQVSATDDLPIGIMHANRIVPGTQNLIGFFSTLVHLRFRMGVEEKSITEFIDHVREATRAIEPHSGVPIGTLIEQGIVDTLPRIFIDSVPRPKMPSINGLSLEDFPFEHPPLFAVADIAIFLFDNGTELTCLLGTNEDMFSETAANTLASKVQSSLAGIQE